MTKFLVSIFIKNKDDILNPEVRKAYGTLSGAVGILCNIFLFLIKFIAGLITSSISITADAFNNLSDAGSSIVTLIGFRMAGKPADIDHPYGHGRIEYISGLIIAFAILLMGFELLKTSVDKILHPEAISFSIMSIAILILSILIKLWMTFFNKGLGKKLNASAMLATATDSLNDCVATAVVLFAVLFCKLTGINIDGFAGLFVALFVLYAGFSTAKDTIEPLLGQAPNPEFIKELEEFILSHKEIIGVHDVIVHDYGPGRVIASIHAEISKDMDFSKAHDIIDNIEDEIREKLGCEITIHMDPIANNDEAVKNIKNSVVAIIKAIDERLNIHDFRITDGPLRKNIVFDLEVPFEFPTEPEALIKEINNKIKSLNEIYFPVIKIDRKG